MKPRIRIYRGIWHCLSRSAGAVLCGLGYTPADAYDDWAHIKNKSEATAVPVATT